MVVERTMDALRNVGDAEGRTGLVYIVENEMDNGWENQVCFEFNVGFRLHCPDTNQNYMRTHPPTVFCFLFSFSLFCLFAFCLSFCLQLFPLFPLPVIYSCSVFISLISDAHIISVFLESVHELRDNRRAKASQLVRCADLTYLLRRVSKIAELTISFGLSVRLSVTPHGTTRLPLDGFLWNLIFEYFSKLCRQNSYSIKIWHDLLVTYMKAYVHLWQYLVEFFLELEMLEIKGLEKIKTHFMSITFFRKSCHLWDNV